MAHDDLADNGGTADDGAELAAGSAGFRHRSVLVGGSSLHVVEAGDPATPSVLFLHGWPESWESWAPMMSIAAARVHAIAIDLPGIGGSTGDATDGSKGQLAERVHRLVEELGLADLTLIGHDAGGMVTYAYLRSFPLRRAVIMDTVVPGVDPWQQVLGNPYIWHFAMHSIPDLPETLVQGHQRDYFDYFFDVLTPDPGLITDDARAAAVAAYKSCSALTAGFSWYRAFGQDARANVESAAGPTVHTPLLYLRGQQEGGAISDYVGGFHRAGIENVTPTVIADAGHFTQLERPAQVWRAIAAFADL